MVDSLPAGARLVRAPGGLRYRTSGGRWFAVSGTPGGDVSGPSGVLGTVLGEDGPERAKVLARFHALEEHAHGGPAASPAVTVDGTGHLAEAVREIRGALTGDSPVVVVASDDGPPESWWDRDVHMRRDITTRWARAHVDGRWCLLEPVSRGSFGVGHRDVIRRRAAVFEHSELESLPSVARGPGLMDRTKAGFCAARLVDMINAVPERPGTLGWLLRIDLIDMSTTRHPVLAIPPHEPKEPR